MKYTDEVPHAMIAASLTFDTTAIIDKLFIVAHR